MRILGLDVGQKTCGIALSDPLKITAQGKESFVFPKEKWEVLVMHIKKYLQEYEIEKIIIGYPTLPSGKKTQTTFMIENFASILSKSVDKEIIFVNENYTTKEANNVMIEANLSRKKRKKHKDKLAAQLILQKYLFNI